MTSNTFCRHLSNGYRIYIKDGEITYHPCCQWQGDYIAFDASELTTQRTKINIDQPWAHSECRRCQQEESVKQSNYRDAGFRVIPADMPPNKVGWLDIQADITCNGGCLICGPWNSSHWQNELARHNEYILKPKTKDLSECIDYIFSNLDTSELRLLQFLGGEPFLSEADSIGLSYITNPEICTLKYTTNGSVYPSDKRMKQWARFDKLLITLSIDGIGDRFNYLRYPLKWSVVEANIKRMIDEFPPNTEFSINHSLTPLNVAYYAEFEHWVDSTFNSSIRIHTHPAYGVMGLENISDAVKDLVALRLGDNHFVTKIVNSIAQQSYSTFINFITKWDLRRGTNWKTTFSDIKDSFD